MSNRTAADVMTHDVVTVRDDVPFKELAQLLASHDFGILPVVDERNRPIGIVSATDLLHKKEYLEKSKPLLFERRANRAVRAKAAGANASDVMTSPVVTVSPQVSLAKAAALMAENSITHLLVTVDNDELVGVVSRGDLLRIFLRTDADIRHDVVHEVIQDRLFASPADIVINVNNGEVTLTGQLPRRSLVLLAGDLTADVDGVITVHNQLSYVFDDTAVSFPFPPTGWAGR